MRKYAQGEGELEIFRGEEAEVVNKHIAKTGKTVADFTDDERSELHTDLDAVRGAEVDTSPKDVKKPLEKSTPKNEE